MLSRHPRRPRFRALRARRRLGPQGARLRPPLPPPPRSERRPGEPDGADTDRDGLAAVPWSDEHPRLRLSAEILELRVRETLDARHPDSNPPFLIGRRPLPPRRRDVPRQARPRVDGDDEPGERED